jgi:hypothetical protein
MKVKVKFLTKMMKNGVLRQPGDVLEMDATAAVLLAGKGGVTIPGYVIKKVERTVVENVLVPENGK